MAEIQISDQLAVCSSLRMFWASSRENIMVSPNLLPGRRDEERAGYWPGAAASGHQDRAVAGHRETPGTGRQQSLAARPVSSHPHRLQHVAALVVSGPPLPSQFCPG